MIFNILSVKESETAIFPFKAYREHKMSSRDQEPRQYVRPPLQFVLYRSSCSQAGSLRTGSHFDVYFVHCLHQWELRVNTLRMKAMEEMNMQSNGMPIIHFQPHT